MSLGMKTRLVTCSQGADTAAACREAADLLRQGQPVVFPTETVYGIGASAADREAVERLQMVKGRPAGKPFTVHIADPADAEAYVEMMPRVTRRFIQKAWPGPLTLILDVSPVFDPERWRARAGDMPPPIPELVFHDGTVGLRCPAHDVARQVLREAAVPVVASSANGAGRPPPFDAQYALRELDGRVPMVLDGGPTRYTSGSTIVRVKSPLPRSRRMNFTPSSSPSAGLTPLMLRVSPVIVTSRPDASTPATSHWTRMSLSDSYTFTGG